MKAISHFIRQFRCQLHQPGASAAAHTSPPAQLSPSSGHAGTRGDSEGGRGLGLLLMGQLALTWAVSPCSRRWQGHCSSARSQLSLAACGAPCLKPLGLAKTTRALEPSAGTCSSWLPSPPFFPLLLQAWGLRGSSLFSPDGHTDTWALSHPPAMPGCHLGRVPREQSRAERSRSCPVPLPAPAPWGHGRALSQPAGGQHPKCLHVQDMNQGGQERRDKRSWPGGCSGSQAAPVPNSVRAAAAPLSPPDQPRARQSPGQAFISLFARLCCPGAKPWHGGSGPGPCLTLTRRAGSSRPCPAVPPCPQARACSTGPARAFLPGEPVLDRLFKGALVPFIPTHV